MRVFLVLATILFLAVSVQPTTLIYKSVDDLVKESDGIVMGTVKKIEAHMNQEGEINTYVTFGNLKLLKGSYQGKEFTLRMEGGLVEKAIKGKKEKERIGLLVHGSPTFQTNERVVLFVQGNGRNIVPLVGWGQGLFRIKETKTGKKIITDDLGNRVFSIKEGHVLKEKRFSPTARVVSVEKDLDKGESKVPEGGIRKTKSEKEQALELEDEEKKALMGKKEMSLDGFEKEIKSRVAKLKALPRPLVSVEVGVKVPVKKELDTKAPSVKAPVLKQLAAPKSEIGILPKRIDTSAEKKADKEKEPEKKEKKGNDK